jgi:hypothetical protein
MKYSRSTLGKRVIEVILLSVLVQGCMADTKDGDFLNVSSITPKRAKGPIIEEIVGAYAQDGKVAGSTPIKFEVRLFREPSGKDIQEGDTLQSGERYRIKFTPSQNGYVYILQFDSSGKMFDLVGMAKFDHYVQAGREYFFPNKGDQIMKLDNTKGIEKIYLLASATPLNNLEATYNNWHSKGEDVAINESFKTATQRGKGPIIENVPDGGGTTAATCEGACIFSRTFRHD